MNYKKIHKNGINDIDWAPAQIPIRFDDVDENDYDDNNNNNINNNDFNIINELNPMRFVTCGNDNKIHIYVCQGDTINSFVEEFFEKEFNY